jgi:hypothetical protein
MCVTAGSKYCGVIFSQSAGLAVIVLLPLQVLGFDYSGDGGNFPIVEHSDAPLPVCVGGTPPQLVFAARYARTLELFGVAWLRVAPEASSVLAAAVY